MTNYMSDIERMRAAVRMFSAVPQSVLEPWTAVQLLRIYEASRASDWDYLPHRWEDWQLEAAALHGQVPQWDDDGCPLRDGKRWERGDG